MFQRLRSTLLAVSACSILAIGHGSATTVSTTSFSSWKTTLTGSPTEADFSAIQYTSYSTSNGLLLGAIGNPAVGFTVTGPDNGSFSLTGVNYTGFKSLEGGSDASATVNIAGPAAGENGLLFALATTNNTPIYVTLSDGETFTEGKGVFGLSISHPITNVTFSTDAGSQVIVDDLWYGMSSLAQDSNGGTLPSTTTPEGCTFLMLSGGLLVVMGAVKRLRPAFSSTIA